MNQKVNRILDFSNTFEKAYEYTLKMISDFIKAPTYSLYYYESKSKTYILKLSIHVADLDVEIGPSYSGLLPHKKESYVHPSTIPDSVATKEINVFKDGEIPLLDICLADKKCLIRIGPVKKINKKTEKKLKIFIVKISPLINNLFELSYMKNEVNKIVTLGKATSNASSMMGDINNTVKIIIGLSVKTLEAAGGAFLLEASTNNFEVMDIIGVDDNIKELFKDDKSLHTLLFNSCKDKEVFSVTDKDEIFYEIPSYLISVGIKNILFFPIKQNEKNGYVFFWFNEVSKIENYRITAVFIIVRRLIDIINNNLKFKELSNSYIDALKMLIQMYDNMTPFTIGNSELHYRYAKILCKELKLDEKETEDICLAASLSNIGILGLSSELLSKTGKYTELEYETMKLHSEVGSSMILATTGNEKVAKYIKHHHERIDGYGYPDGLKDDEIPIGSKIIAVIQTFLAKIFGRPERDPVSFETAMDLLKNSAGSQLNSEIVNVLLSWFSKKQEKAELTKSLGPCWEMRCSPKRICIQCPAYKQYKKSCWEFGGEYCSEHGNTCKTCFIHTEYIYRNSK
jgi:HD-GYP domain-containing protein (c-di-GMP phosphodiesterase class II)